MSFRISSGSRRVVGYLGTFHVLFMNTVNLDRLLFSHTVFTYTLCFLGNKTSFKIRFIIYHNIFSILILLQNSKILFFFFFFLSIIIFVDNGGFGIRKDNHCAKWPLLFHKKYKSRALNNKSINRLWLIFHFWLNYPYILPGAVNIYTVVKFPFLPCSCYNLCDYSRF